MFDDDDDLPEPPPDDSTDSGGDDTSSDTGTEDTHYSEAENYGDLSLSDVERFTDQLRDWDVAQWDPEKAAGARGDDDPDDDPLAQRNLSQESSIHERGTGNSPRDDKDIIEQYNREFGRIAPAVGSSDYDRLISRPSDRCYGDEPGATLRAANSFDKSAEQLEREEQQEKEKVEKEFIEAVLEKLWDKGIDKMIETALETLLHLGEAAAGITTGVITKVFESTETAKPDVDQVPLPTRPFSPQPNFDQNLKPLP